METGFRTWDSGFLVSGNWISYSNRYWDYGFLSWIPYSKAQDFGFHQQRFSGFRYLDNLTEAVIPTNNRGLKQRRRRRQRERQKGNMFRSTKQQLCTCITRLFAFLCCRCTITTWKCLILRFVEDVNEDDDFLSLFLNFDTVFKNSTSEKFANIWRIERVRICAIKFEVKRIHVYILIRYPGQTNIKHLACDKHPQLGCVNTSRVRPSLLCLHQQNGWK